MENTHTEDPASDGTKPPAVQSLVTNSTDAQMLHEFGGYLTDLVEAFGKQMKDTEALKLEGKKLEIADRPKRRAHDLAVKRSNNLLIAFSFAAVLSLAGYALGHGKDQFASDLVKYVLSTGIGALGGYGVATAKHNKSSKADDD